MFSIRSSCRAALLALGLLSVAMPAVAQVADQRLGACPERVALGDDELYVATAMSMLGEGARPAIRVMPGDDGVKAMVSDCAASIAYHVCTDDLLLGMIDPASAMAGGLLGLAVDARNGSPSLLGGLLGSGVVGMVGGVVKSGMCRQNQAELVPHAQAALGGMSFRLENARSRGDDLAAIRGAIGEAARNRRVPLDRAQVMDSYVREVGGALTR